MEMSIERLKEVYLLGVAAAEGLKEGSVFKGAFGHAADAGIVASDFASQSERSIFTTAFLAVLDRRFPKGVTMTRDNVIVQPAPQFSEQQLAEGVEVAELCAKGEY